MDMKISKQIHVHPNYKSNHISRHQETGV